MFSKIPTSKTYEALLRWLLRRRGGENVFLPVLRYYIFYMLLVTLIVVGLSQISKAILPLEVVYVMLAAGVILFVVKFSFYWMAGKIHGRLGFTQSNRFAVSIALLTGTFWLLGVVALKNIAGEQSFPIAYTIVSTLGVPIVLYAGAKYLGRDAIDWIEEVGRFERPDSKELS